MKNQKNFFVIASILFGCLFVQNVEAVQFNDVGGSPYREAIEELANDGVVEGYGDGTYKPGQNINRAEFLKIVMASKPGINQKELQDCTFNYLPLDWQYAFFPDVSTDAWYAPYACLAKVRNIVEGYPDGTYKPGQNISYVEALKIIYEANEDDGLDNPSGEQWYAPYTEDAQRNNIAIGLAYDKKITRGEMAQLMVNYLHNKEAPSINVNEEDFFTYMNEDKGFKIKLPAFMKDYQAFETATYWDTCDTNYTLLHFIPPAQVNVGMDSYDDLGSYMPFNVGWIESKDLCNAGMQELFLSRDNWCEEDPYWCQVYTDLKFIKTPDGKFLLEYIPLYNSHMPENPKGNVLFFKPTEDDIKYMRESFELL